jgi:hypothetical protein
MSAFRQFDFSGSGTCDSPVRSGRFVMAAEPQVTQSIPHSRHAGSAACQRRLGGPNGPTGVSSDRTEEVSGEAVAVCCDAPPVFYATEHSLDDIAIEWIGLVTSAGGRGDGLCTEALQPI